MEVAACVRKAFVELKPDCVAVELPEPLQKHFLQASARLPDISVVTTEEYNTKEKLIYLVEPCDAHFEALRSACEGHIPSFCIDLDVVGYPEMNDPYPDPYAIHKIGLENYYKAFFAAENLMSKTVLDHRRELFMAKKLRELSFSYEKILVVMGMSHVKGVLSHIYDTSFPQFQHEKKEALLATLTEKSCRDVLAEYGWISKQYELWRQNNSLDDTCDRQKLIFDLLKSSKEPYEEEMRAPLPHYALAMIMKFSRNYAHIKGMLLPHLFELLSASKGAVDHNFAYEVWKLAGDYPHLKNIDNLPELDLSIDDVWGKTKKIHFHMKMPSKKSFQSRLQKERSTLRFFSPNPFSICSYPREDKVIEDYGDLLKKRGVELAREEDARTIPFSVSLEDGIDVRESIRHFAEKKLYVKAKGKPPGQAGSVVVIFDADSPEKASKREVDTYTEKYPWRLSWLGENEQESDMAFYATPIDSDIVGPGIARCEYGGFMMSYPPRRLHDIWHDPDYASLRTKAQVLLTAAIDYAIEPLIIYVASKPPEPFFKRYAERFSKRILFMPLSQFSQVTLKKLRIFHVLDSYQRRQIADDYIH